MYPLIARILARFRGDKKYTAIFLDAPSQRSLLKWWRDKVQVPLHEKTSADHVTLVFDPSPEEQAKYPHGGKVSVRVIGWAADEKGQAVLVSSRVPSKNRFPHVTVATAPGVAAVYSNELLAQGYTSVAGPFLFGEIDTRV